LERGVFQLPDPALPPFIFSTLGLKDLCWIPVPGWCHVDFPSLDSILSFSPPCIGGWTSPVCRGFAMAMLAPVKQKNVHSPPPFPPVFSTLEPPVNVSSPHLIDVRGGFLWFDFTRKIHGFCLFSLDEIVRMTPLSFLVVPSRTVSKSGFFPLGRFRGLLTVTCSRAQSLRSPLQIRVLPHVWPDSRLMKGPDLFSLSFPLFLNPPSPLGEIFHLEVLNCVLIACAGFSLRRCGDPLPFFPPRVSFFPPLRRTHDESKASTAERLMSV